MDPIEVAERLAIEISERYVYPDTGSLIADAIRTRAAQIPPNTGPDEVAARLTSWAVEASNDRHIEVLHVPAPLTGPTTLDTNEFATARRQRAHRNNYGVARIERLAGNVGLIELTSFFEPVVAGDVITSAMQVISHMDALIVDLRNNRGGFPGTVSLVLTYLFDEEDGPVHLNDLYYRDGDRIEQHWTLPYVPGRRFGANKPVFVLTSSQTFSAAEEFAYDLRACQRATIIGERTAGGAHPGDRIRLDDNFTVFIPTGRAINPITATNWEATGVIPDVAVPSHQAQMRAHRLVLQRLLKQGTGDPDLTAETATALASVMASDDADQ